MAGKEKMLPLSEVRFTTEAGEPLDAEIGDWAENPYYKGDNSPFKNLDDSGIFYEQKRKKKPVQYRLDTRFLSSMQLELKSGKRVKALDAWFVSPSLVAFFNDEKIRDTLNKALNALETPPAKTELIQIIRGTTVHGVDPSAFHYTVVAAMLSAQENASDLFERSALIFARQFAGDGSTATFLLIVLILTMIGYTTYFADVPVGSSFVEEQTFNETQFTDRVNSSQATFARPISEIIQTSATQTVEEISEGLKYVFLETRGGNFAARVFNKALELVDLTGSDSGETVIEINTNSTAEPYELQISNPDQFTLENAAFFFLSGVFDLLIDVEGSLDPHGRTLFVHTAQDFGADNPGASEEIVKPLTPLESMVFFHIHLAKNPRVQEIARLVVDGYAWVGLIRDPALRLRVVDEMVAAFPDKTGLADEFALFTALLKFRYGSVKWTDKMTEQLVTAAARIASLRAWTVAPFAKIVKRERFDRTFLRPDNLQTQNVFTIKGDPLVKETVDLLTHNEQFSDFDARSAILSFAKRHGVEQQTLAGLVGSNGRPAIIF